MKNLIASSYFLQCCAVVLMVFSITIGYQAWLHQNDVLIIFDALLFCANLVLFIWQYRIRQWLRRRPQP